MLIRFIISFEDRLFHVAACKSLHGTLSRLLDRRRDRLLGGTDHLISSRLNEWSGVGKKKIAVKAGGISVVGDRESVSQRFAAARGARVKSGLDSIVNILKSQQITVRCRNNIINTIGSLVQ